ncbi:uncharacterized protein BO87DRAFT_20426 [Aspergillus neoniger CBS 115656]|uniref:Uncharacterized protein n=1 Tax=Aspergillus neoniger (strain CBS 115656) TaxID=1448310 RepID=A0A318YUI6_ASPNB|nr:hypothetical protein BO87DRAFT_20426 [Aspergillus neoniger CBS 115656]PYH35630.1 hypothetical protein BO87DRAFT_20426 [Aspergillus neoniger CBS 115656]
MPRSGEHWCPCRSPHHISGQTLPKGSALQFLLDRFLSSTTSSTHFRLSLLPLHHILAVNFGRSWSRALTPCPGQVPIYCYPNLPGAGLDTPQQKTNLIQFSKKAVAPSGVGLVQTASTGPPIGTGDWRLLLSNRANRLRRTEWDVAHPVVLGQLVDESQLKGLIAES